MGERDKVPHPGHTHLMMDPALMRARMPAEMRVDTSLYSSSSSLLGSTSVTLKVLQAQHRST